MKKAPVMNNPEAYGLSGEALEAMVRQEIAKRAQQNEEPKDQEIKLDKEDGLYLELLLLKRHNEQLQIALEDKRREEASRNIEHVRVELQEHLITKYSIDSEKYSVEVDAKTYTLRIKVKNDMGPDDKRN